MTDFGLGDEVISEEKRAAAVRWHFGTYYYQPERPTPADLLTNPPYQTGRDYDAACGSGAWIVEATKEAEGEQ